MMKMMPIIFTFVLAPLAVGLLIYYSWSNLLTILQQYIVMRRYQVETPIDRIIARLTGKTPAATG
jgi:YidC/Oxa1 family membrane protein insertase